jgi:hypothetical protein
LIRERRNTQTILQWIMIELNFESHFQHMYRKCYHLSQLPRSFNLLLLDQVFKILQSYCPFWHLLSCRQKSISRFSVFLSMQAMSNLSRTNCIEIFMLWTRYYISSSSSLSIIPPRLGFSFSFMITGQPVQEFLRVLQLFQIHFQARNAQFHFFQANLPQSSQYHVHPQSPKSFLLDFP